MQLPDTLTDKQKAAVLAYHENNSSERAAAKALGISKQAIRQSLFLAQRKGALLKPDSYCEHAPAGFEMTHGTLHIIDGEVKQSWPRIKPAISTEDLAEYLSQRIPISTLKLPELRQCNENLMCEWPVFDAHHGMLAWAAETGNDYDHKISRHLQIGAGKIIFGAFGPIQKATIILGGDNQTSDNKSGMTEKSGNIVDRDSRFQKMIWCSYEAAVSCIEIAANFAQQVEVIVLSGNHDYHSALHLTIQLHAHFRAQKRITINISPAKHRFYTWGKNVFMATHGDISEKRIGSFALQQTIRQGFAFDPDMRLHVRMGHLHKAGRKTPDMLVEEDGVIIERFPTLAATEAYAVDAAYTSLRTTSATLWHKDYPGRQGLRDVTVGEILERFPLKTSKETAH